MAAFLKLDTLWARAVPDLPRVVHEQVPARPFPTSPPRPLLSARWLVAPDDRLTCRWHRDATTPDRPPPH